MMTTVPLAHRARYDQAQLSVRLELMTRTAMELGASHAPSAKLTETSIRPPNVRIAWPASSHLRLGQRNAPSAQQVRRQMVSVLAPHAHLASISVLRRANARTVLLAWLISTEMLALCARVVTLEDIRLTQLRAHTAILVNFKMKEAKTTARCALLVGSPLVALMIRWSLPARTVQWVKSLPRRHHNARFAATVSAQLDQWSALDAKLESSRRRLRLLVLRVRLDKSLPVEPRVARSASLGSTSMQWEKLHVNSAHQAGLHLSQALTCAPTVQPERFQRTLLRVPRVVLGNVY